MYAVRWDYYGNGDKVLASYGTKILQQITGCTNQWESSLVLRNLFVVHYRKERMERDTGQLQFQHWVIKM